MNKQPNKGLKRTLVLGAMALTLSLPIGAAGALAATSNTAPVTQKVTVNYGFDLNAFLKQYFPGYYYNKPTTTTTKPTTTAKPTTTTTTKPVTTTPASSSQGTVATSEYATQVVSLVNQERAKAGLPALKVTNPALKLVALDKAKDMYNNNYFSHTSPTYGSPFDMMKQYGVTYRAAGENIAKGQRSPQEVMNAWMNSAGHRANILNAGFTTIGVAYYNGVWVQEFIG
ncbi:CAP domain-containing protein [Cohnella panacarvi]|uniref:CAP domain-containing protein n=1 Tax=Cohnella panacarvi TaxID=400776 RepID=UPI00047E6741|nr:CAP domain-containing protein [Cohnella panacarvi]